MNFIQSFFFNLDFIELYTVFKNHTESYQQDNLNKVILCSFSGVIVQHNRMGIRGAWRVLIDAKVTISNKLSISVLLGSAFIFCKS